ncbi:hypothetical protein BH10BDE1_BH10BDE1_28040 [soil metagenome]
MMKFSIAWAEIANQNLILKIALTCLSLSAICFSLVSLKLALKEPLVIERSCFNRVIKSADSRRSNEEIETFVRIALARRFDTAAKNDPEYVDALELSNRAQEQKELATRQLKQKLVVNSVAIDGADVSVDADRIITVGSIRSALAMPLKLKVESQERSENNPYGLLLKSVKAIEKKEAK